jgi:hypothetical protein
MLRPPGRLSSPHFHLPIYGIECGVTQSSGLQQITETPCAHFGAEVLLDDLRKGHPTVHVACEESVSFLIDRNCLSRHGLIVR